MKNNKDSETNLFQLLKTIEIDQNLLAQIEKYAQEVQVNPNYEKFLWFRFEKCSFYIYNIKTIDANIRDNKNSGIILWTDGSCFLDDETLNIFINSELFPLLKFGILEKYLNGEFVSIERLQEECKVSSLKEIMFNRTYNHCMMTYLNFKFNTELLCKTIQYLANCFDYPTNTITFTCFPNFS